MSAAANANRLISDSLIRPSHRFGRTVTRGRRRSQRIFVNREIEGGVPKKDNKFEFTK
jgi:hypothetical protein